jgi:DNA-binding transcriptional regulator YdaS (Cro superfamily)
MLIIAAMKGKNGGSKHILAYLSRHQLTQAVFAKRIGVGQSMVSQWVTHRRPISPQAAIRIEEKTKGEVSRSDLRSDLWQQAA